MKNTYVRTRNVNVDPYLHIPDSYIAYAEYILSCGDDIRYDSVCINGINDTSFPHCLSLKVNDLYSRFDNINDVAKLMILILRSIPIDLETRDCDYCGLYCSGNNVEMPRIILFPEIIFKDTKDELDRKLKVAKTLIHELSHAVMDPCNYGLPCDNIKKYREYAASFCGEKYYHLLAPEKMNFYHVREESFANLLTLRIFLKAEKKKNCFRWMGRVNKYIRRQPAPYSLALELGKLKVSDAGNIGEWVKCKTHGIIEQDCATKWMKVAEILHTSNKKERFSMFPLAEGFLGVPWSNNHIKSYPGFQQGEDNVYNDALYDFYCEGRAEHKLVIRDRYVKISKNNGQEEVISGGHLFKNESGNYFSYSKNEKWGLISIGYQDETIMEFDYDEPLKISFGWFIIAKRNGKFGIVSRKGKVLEDFQYDTIEEKRVDGLGFYYWNGINKAGSQLISLTKDIE